MITKNPMQLKAFIKKKASEKNVSAQLVGSATKCCVNPIRYD